MGRTSEALERAEKEYQQKSDAVPRPTPTPARTILPKPAHTCNGAECYQSLKTNLLNRYPNQTIKTIIFCATGHGDGSTTTAVNFATTLARDCRVSVLLVDANLRTPYLHDMFQVANSPGLADYVGNGNKIELPLVRTGPGKLFILPCGSAHAGPIGLFETQKFDRFLQEAGERFDYVILDAPPVPAFAESTVICPKVDGVVLVVGAGKTRKQVAQRAKKELEASGGRVLGVVINRRKFHIPAWIYGRL